MAHKRMDASSVASLQAPDDFTRIHGIGPAIQKCLHSAGIITFSQLASLPPETIAAIVSNLSVNKITKQSWLDQARKFASGQENSKTLQKESTAPASRQHYENFTIEFLLGEKNKIRRVQIVSVQSGDIDTLTKWDPERLIDFLAHHAGIHLRYAKSSAQNTLEQKPAASSSASTELSSEHIRKLSEDHELVPAIEPASTQSSPPALAVASLAGTTPQKPSSSTVSASPINTIRLLEWKTLLNNTDQVVRHLTPDQSFEVDLTLDLASAGLAEISNFSLAAALYAKKLDNGSRQMIAEAQISRHYESVINLIIGNATLPQGLYRLEALLSLSPKDASLSTRPCVNTSFRGGLVQVY